MKTIIISHNGGAVHKEAKLKLKNGEQISVDVCIIKEIIKLNNLGIKTVASCCMHKEGRYGRLVVEHGFEDAIKELSYKQVGTYKSPFLGKGTYTAFRTKTKCIGACKF